MRTEREKQGRRPETKEKMSNQPIGGGEVNDLLNSSFDERYDYLLKNGKITRHSHTAKKMLVRLPQIPNTLVFYRKDSLRNISPWM